MPPSGITGAAGPVAMDQGEFPELDLSFVNPLRSVEDETVRRQLPGGTGWATGIYSRIAPEREQNRLGHSEVRDR